MNIATDHKTISTPICVDLDGTLIKSDMLHEAIFMLVRMNLFYIFLLPLWWLKGKAHLKAEIAKRVMPDVRGLPYRKELIEWLKTQKKNGRILVLATATHVHYANAVAEHLGIFDKVEASDETTSLSSGAKADRLVELFGENGFDYLGNGNADIAVWDKARKAITVGDERAALVYAKQEHAERFTQSAPEKSTIRIWLKAIRVHQWLKNSLLFVPVILAFNTLTATSVAAVILAFISFSLCASSVYLLNDLIDIEVDRKHKTKQLRAIPSGQITITQAASVSILLLAISFGLSLFLPLAFTGILALYYITTCAYSFALKRMLLIDVLTLAGLFTIRVLAGATAISATVSAWLLAFSMFFFLSLALVKRFVEVSNQLEDAGRKETGRGYQAVDLETLGQSGIASGFAAVVVLALFVDSPQIAENYQHPEVIWLVCPLVLYLIIRIWILARRKHMHDDPVVFLMTDWRSQIMIAAGAILMLISQMV
ncbi:MAG: UbiA family prenyltransferase [Rhizobiaceae bacterium]